MEKENKTVITVQVTVKASPEKVWKYWNEPEHITQWCQASNDWHAPKAVNDLRIDGRFVTTMAAKDGSLSFDFGGTYTNVEKEEKIEYIMDDGRVAVISFFGNGNETKVVESFEAESQNPIDLQEAGWQAILNNFKK